MVNKPLIRPYFWREMVRGGLVDQPWKHSFLPRVARSGFDPKKKQTFCNIQRPFFLAAGFLNITFDREYSFPHTHESGQCLYLKGNYYWRDPFLTPMILGRSVKMKGKSISVFLLVPFTDILWQRAVYKGALRLILFKVNKHPSQLNGETQKTGQLLISQCVSRRLAEAHLPQMSWEKTIE